MIKLNSTNRLTKAELEFYQSESGITELQFKILKRRYYDKDQPTITAVCFELNISPKKYNRELHKAITQINRLTQSHTFS